MPALVSQSDPAAPRRRSNALAEFERPPAPPVDARRAARTFMGFLLLGIGLGVALWLVYMIHAAVTRPDGVGILRRFDHATAELRTMSLPSGQVTLPPAALTAAGYLFLVLLLAIGAKISLTLVKEGSWMLRWDSRSDPGPAGNADDNAQGTG